MAGGVKHLCNAAISISLIRSHSYVTFLVSAVAYFRLPSLNLFCKGLCPCLWLNYTLGTVHCQYGIFHKDTLGTFVHFVHWTQYSLYDIICTNIIYGVVIVAISEARHRANEKWNKSAYEEIKVRVKTGEKEKIQAVAQANGESVNAFINRLINDELERLCRGGCGISPSEQNIND